MKRFLILHTIIDAQRKTNVEQRIQAIGAWAHMSDNVWFVDTNDNLRAVDIRELIAERSMTREEQIFVVEITRSAWASYNIGTDISSWLKR